MAKSKKGVEPPALKKYRLAKKKRRKNPVRDPAHKKLVKSLSSHFASDEKALRLADVFRLAIKKGSQTLYLNADGDKFVKTGRFKYYATSSGAKDAAQALASKFPTLRGWSFYAVT